MCACVQGYKIIMADIVDIEAKSSRVNRFLTQEEYEKQGKVYTRLCMYELIRNEDKTKLSEHPFYLRNLHMRSIANFITSVVVLLYVCICALCSVKFPSFKEVKSYFHIKPEIFDVLLNVTFAVLLRTVFDEVSMMLKIDYYNKNEARPALFSVLYGFEFAVYYKAIFYSLSMIFFHILIKEDISWLLIVFSFMQDLVTDTKETFLIGTVVALPVYLCRGIYPATITLYALLSACKYVKIKEIPTKMKTKDDIRDDNDNDNDNNDQQEKSPFKF